MKVVLVLLAVIVGIWLFKAGRRAPSGTGSGRPGKPKPADPLALEMVQCQYCNVHLPRPDAFEGKKGPYCSLNHKQQAEP